MEAGLGRLVLGDQSVRMLRSEDPSAVVSQGHQLDVRLLVTTAFPETAAEGQASHQRTVIIRSEGPPRRSDGGAQAIEHAERYRFAEAAVSNT
ncbi:hypothetical protein AB0M36_17125 [Actinoplanes sp. NPDC051346]|uniref:hypothetical protein n=1 Tax=Actinoplanes sp. NPDC051346 TaxID=3155048 RepID=UPI003446CEC4